MQPEKHFAEIEPKVERDAPSTISEADWEKIAHRMETLNRSLNRLVRLMVGVSVVLLVTIFFLLDPNTLNHLTACSTG